MTVRFVQHHVFDIDTPAIAIGLNSSGQLGASPWETTLRDRHPVFVSDYRKRGRAGLLTPGEVWVWRTSHPWLIGLIIRETPQGIARPRYIERALQNLQQNWEREGLTRLVIAPLADGPEWVAVRPLFEQYLQTIPLDVTVCTYPPTTDSADN
jgi:hypothetical protein